MSSEAPTRTEAPATSDGLLELPDDGWRYELVEGKLRQMSPAGGMHGILAARIGSCLTVFALESGIGETFAAETGFLLSRDPDTVRAPDAAFVRGDRLPAPEALAGFQAMAPDLAVEVVSPADRATQVAEKTASWLDAGTRLVWVVYPDRRMVAEHHPDGTAQLLRGEQTLTGGDVMPGFRLPLPELFG
ncbi:MAG: Uma2 family endonuclease [Euzebyales bacterium]|jgi:Uma2 family endonuclease|nr:Uma2 family endonuclease [Euzebyales bacterium]